MFKFSFVLIVALAALLIQQNEAFIIVSKSIDAAPSASASAAPAFNPNALIQGLTSAVTAKIQTVQQVVNGLVQAKANFKQSLLQGVLNKVSTVSAALPRPTYITKTIRIPVFVKGGAAPTAPASTTAASTAAPEADAITTTSQSAGYAVKYRLRH